MTETLKQQYSAYARQEEWAGKPSMLGRKDVFKSSHWDEPNVIAHIRMNDRTGPNGEKVLFVEEIQSDFSRELKAQQKVNIEIIDTRWGGLLERMNNDGILKVVCP